jgi:TruD family tRNA pseudouridine synthase
MENGTGERIMVTMVKCRLTVDHAIQKVYDLLGKSPKEVQITYAGTKDRWAVTAQRIVISGNITFQEVNRCCMPDESELYSRDGSGVFLKDPMRVRHELRNGQLVGNNFIIRVEAAGQTCSNLKAYIDHRIQKLSARHGRDIFIFPNALGRQRLGKRQNLFKIGTSLLINGPEAGIKLFLTDTNDHEKPEAQDARRRIAAVWAEAESRAAANGETVAQQTAHLKQILSILTENVGGYRTQNLYERHNMVWEYKIVTKLIETRNYETTMRELYKVFSMWIGAYQGFWFNQVLGKVLRGEIVLDGNEPDYEKQIPLFVDHPQVFKFYGRYMPEALPVQMDETVRKVFINTETTGKNRRNGKPIRYNRKPPRRPLFVACQGFEFECSDGVATLRFMLRSGAYATTLLDILFDIQQPE